MKVLGDPLGTFQLRLKNIDALMFLKRNVNQYLPRRMPITTPTKVAIVKERNADCLALFGSPEPRWNPTRPAHKQIKKYIYMI